MDTLQDMRDRLRGIDLMAEMTAEGAGADENLGKVHGCCWWTRWTCLPKW